MHWHLYPNFTEDEFRCRCGCGAADMDPEFMDRLQQLRTALKVPLVVTSGFRCPAHNRRVSTTGWTGPHTTGKAADIAARGELAVDLVTYGASFGFTGFGIHQKGAARFIHLDTLGPTEAVRPTMWSY